MKFIYLHLSIAHLISCICLFASCTTHDFRSPIMVDYHQTEGMLIITKNLSLLELPSSLVHLRLEQVHIKEEVPSVSIFLKWPVLQKNQLLKKILTVVTGQIRGAIFPRIKPSIIYFFSKFINFRCDISLERCDQFGIANTSGIFLYDSGRQFIYQLTTNSNVIYVNRMKYDTSSSTMSFVGKPLALCVDINRTTHLVAGTCNYSPNLKVNSRATGFVINGKFYIFSSSFVYIFENNSFFSKKHIKEFFIDDELTSSASFINGTSRNQTVIMQGRLNMLFASKMWFTGILVLSITIILIILIVALFCIYQRSAALDPKATKQQSEPTKLNQNDTAASSKQKLEHQRSRNISDEAIAAADYQKQFETKCPIKQLSKQLSKHNSSNQANIKLETKQASDLLPASLSMLPSLLTNQQVDDRKASKGASKSDNKLNLSVTKRSVARSKAISRAHSKKASSARGTSKKEFRKASMNVSKKLSTKNECKKNTSKQLYTSQKKRKRHSRSKHL